MPTTTIQKVDMHSHYLCERIHQPYSSYNAINVPTKDCITSSSTVICLKFSFAMQKLMHFVKEKDRAKVFMYNRGFCLRNHQWKHTCPTWNYNLL